MIIKIKKFLPLILSGLLVLILSSSLASIVQANGNPSRVSIDIDKFVDETECLGENQYRLTGRYRVKNVSGDDQQVILLNTRDWLHSNGYAQSKTTASIGSYSWEIVDISGTVLDADYQ